jgi:hypothetical protein
MPSYELPDHVIAHTVHQSILEKRQVEVVAEVNEFWENEQLQVAEQNEICIPLRQDEFDLLPATLYNMKETNLGNLRIVRKG